MHCELTLTDDAWELRDLNSVNGTWVNGASVRQGRIEPGSTLKVGDTTLRFEFADGFFETLPTKRVDVPQMPVDRDAPEAEGGGGPSVGEKAAKWRARTAARAESAAAMTDELLADEESEDEVMERGLDLSVPHAAAPRAAAPAPRAFGPIGASRGGGTMFGAAPMPSPPGGPPPGASMPAPMSAPMPAPGAPSPSFGAAPPSAAYGAPPPAAAAPVMIGAMAGPPAASMGPLPAKRGGILSRIVDAFTGSSDGAEPFAPPVRRGTVASAEVIAEAADGAADDARADDAADDDAAAEPHGAAAADEPAAAATREVALHAPICSSAIAAGSMSTP
jgi:hypothetical protein